MRPGGFRPTRLVAWMYSALVLGWPVTSMSPNRWMSTPTEIILVAKITSRVSGSGRLTAILQRPANDVWVVEGVDGAEHLVPATKDAVVGVDLEAGRVTVQDWLFEVEEAR